MITENDEIRERLANKLVEMYPEYGKFDVCFAYCPYCVVPVGAYIENQLGKSVSFALDKGVNVAFVPSSNDELEITSINNGSKVKENVSNVSAKQNDWADYLRGITKELHEKYGITKGINCVIYGSITIPDTKSMILAFLKALCFVNNLSMTDEEVNSLIQIVQRRYMNMNWDYIDLSNEIYSRKNELFYHDMGRHEIESLEAGLKMPRFCVAVFSLGEKGRIDNAIYKTRVDESKKAAYELKNLARVYPGDIDDSYLRDVPRDVFRIYGKDLPDSLRKRAEYFYNEMELVGRTVVYWKQGKIVPFGRVVANGGEAAIRYYEASSKPLNRLNNIINETEGVYGGRVLDGYGIGIIDPRYAEDVKFFVRERFLERYPEYTGFFDINVCGLGNGENVEYNKILKLQKKI